MPTRSWVFACLLLVTSLMGQGFSQQSTQLGGFPSVGQLNRFGLKMAWWNQATIDPGRSTVRHLTADEQVVFVQTTGGAVTAIDMESGKKLWSIQLGRKDSPSFPVTTNDELALILAGLDLYAIEKLTGELEWRIRLPGQPSTSPVMDDTQVYVGMLDGSVYASNLRKIGELYEQNLLPEWSFQALTWRYKANDRITTPPIAFQDFVAFSSEDHSLYSVAKEGRELRFQMETDAPITAPMTHSDGYLFMASKDFNVYAVSLTSGKIRWQYVTGLPIIIGPKAVLDNLYVTPVRGGMYQLSTTSGREQWWNGNMTEFVAESNRFVFATDTRGDLSLLDKETGGSRGSLPLRHFSKRISNEKTDRVIMSTPSGLVMMLREQDQEFPRYYMNPERRPIIPELASDAPEPMP